MRWSSVSLEVTYSNPKVTHSYPKVTYSYPRVTYSDPKVTYRDPTHLSLPPPGPPEPLLAISWVKLNLRVGGWVVLGKGLSFEAFHLTGHPLPILAWPLPELHNSVFRLRMLATWRREGGNVWLEERRRNVSVWRLVQLSKEPMILYHIQSSILN